MTTPNKALVLFTQSTAKLRRYLHNPKSKRRIKKHVYAELVRRRHGVRYENPSR